MSLLGTRCFLPLFLTQFLGAFNDNLFKNALVMLITYRLTLSPELDPQRLVTLASAIFILPFFLFSATAGQIADRYDRARIARVVKQMEILLAAGGILAFANGSLPLLFLVLFGFGLHSTFFGPVKYALLPQHLRAEELLLGNAYIEAATFLAILLGTLGGGLLMLHAAGEILLAAAVMLCAVAGYFASRFIPAAPAAAPARIDWNLPRATWRLIAEVRSGSGLFPVILAISWFWLVGAVFLSQFPGLARYTLNADGTVVTLLPSVFSVGIGIGSFLCNLLLRGKVTLTYVPLACLGISLFTADAWWALSSFTASASMIDAGIFLQSIPGLRVTFDLLCVAICGGLYIVPLYSFLQERSPPAARARVIAANNILNASFMVMGALGTVWLLSRHFTVPEILLAVACVNLLAAALLWRRRK